MRMREPRSGVEAQLSPDDAADCHGIAIGRAADGRRGAAAAWRQPACPPPAHDLGVAFACARTMLEWLAREAGVVSAVAARNASGRPAAPAADPVQPPAADPS
ncbi:MAG TPA: hypothetical protein VMR06_02750 [Dokdonella sp.]|uniref:hypothetical protein n=1 Tax=Dokdonella sp. TaxID=2291710 RepID=UPI002C8E5EB5|nr:hypothetical protein [Dokdonella sp.]HUD40897.1 hypothetical protein [Dokdonella sp.]